MIYTKIQFGITFLVILLEIVWIKFSSVSFYYPTEGLFVLALFFLALFLLYLFYKKVRPVPNIALLIQSTLFVYAFSPAMIILSYLEATANQPLVDSTLAAVDHYLGIYTPNIVFWVRDHPWWHAIIYYIYWVYYGIQLPFVILYFTFRDETTHLQRVLMQFIIATIITGVISAIFPAFGPYYWYQYAPSEIPYKALHHLQELRQNIVDIRQIDGIVTLPSFHTVMALIYAFAFRNEKKFIFIPIFILNIVMILTCVPIGNHYFADLLAAIPVFLVTIGVEVLIYKWVTRFSLKNIKKTKKLSILAA